MRSPVLSFGKRRVSVDANIIMAVVAYNSKSLPPVFDRIRRKDTLVVTNIIMMQCLRQTRKKQCRLTEEQIRTAVLGLCPEITIVDILPLEELRKRYSIRDESDLETLHSIAASGTDVFITGDGDFRDPKRPIGGVKVVVLTPNEYLEEGE